ncbi:MAG: carbamoyltransferase [Bacteroidia bacterium]|jgi:carbamoyltransferase
MFLKNRLRSGLKHVEKYDKKTLKLLFPEHHLSHAASAFYPSGFEEAAILTIDGVGEWSTASIGVGKGNRIEILEEMHFPHSVGLLYSAATYFLGFTVNSGEYKLMGLAPYSSRTSANVLNFKAIIEDKLVDVKSDGSIWLNQAYFSYATALRMVPDKKWEVLFGFSRRKEDQKLERKHSDLALAFQMITEDVVLKMAKSAIQKTGKRNLCLAGGVALNCVANGSLVRESWLEEIFIQPAAGDAGGALGAALAAEHLYFDGARLNAQHPMDAMKGSYLGPEFSDNQIIEDFERLNASYQEVDNLDALTEQVVQHLTASEVVGWFQGRMEFGPRALGNRSIIANPMDASMQHTINLKIKRREGFRPFAPAVLKEDASKFFNLKVDSPYMLLVASVLEKHRKGQPDNYFEASFEEQLETPRSNIQAVTHMDYSARVQTVDRNTNASFHALITRFKQETGV